MSPQVGVVRLDLLMPGVIRDVQRKERLLPNLSLMEWAVNVAKRVFTWCAALGADLAIWMIRRRSAKLPKHVLFFEGAKGYLLKAMVERAECPPMEVLDELRELCASTSGTLAQGDRLIAILRDANPASRLAAEVERVNQLFRSIAENVAFIIDLIEEGQQHATVLQKLGELNASANRGIATYMDDEDFDPELVALAQQAIERINVDSRTPAQARG